MTLPYLMRSSTIISYTLFSDGLQKSIKTIKIIMIAFVSN